MFTEASADMQNCSGTWVCTSLPQETHQNTFTLPSGGFARADLVNCMVMELKTNMQNRVASLERVIKRVEEHRR